MLGKRIITIVINAVTLFALLSSPHSLDKGDELQQIAQPYAYSVLRWEVSNLWNKGFWRLRHWGRTGLSAGEEIQVVREYFSQGQEISSVQRDINRISIISTEEEANLESLKSRLAVLKAERAKREDMVEDIIEEQVSQVLADEGRSVSLGFGRRARFVFPPVAFELGDTPRILAISPRHTIELSRTFLLKPTLDLREMEEIEREVGDKRQSALVELLSGMATYPSNIAEDASLEWGLNTVAHEWLHQYFLFQPLGRRYWSSNEMRAINETAAKIGGAEIGSLVLERYYGDGKTGSTEAGNPAAKQAFDFRAEMRDIRTSVEEYLRRGEIDEAEEFMRGKQKFLASKGYFIRKLNQAYFAFYGTYADSPASISPLGGELAQLREQSASLGEFIRVVAKISSYEGLKSLLARDK